jgi:small conductance mechanosensitive channel
MVDKMLDILGTFSMTAGAKIIGALLILVIGLKLSKYIVKIISNLRFFKTIDPTAQTFIRSFISILFKVVVVISAAGVLGVPMASVVTIVGSCGVAVGLAMQGGLSNLAGGLIILILKPFKVDDYIVENGVEGTVSSIGIFYTTLVTPDNKRVLIPNGSLMNSTITAVNQLETRRVDMVFSVSYNSDVDKVKSILKNVAQENPAVLREPEIQTVVLNHGESSVDFALRVWTKTENYWTVHFDLMEKVKKAFDENEIEIPYPQMDVHMK